MKFLLIAAGGMIGALMRYGVSELMYKTTSGALPWGTITVNLIGSLIIGLLWGLMNTDEISVHTKHLVFIGILGSFTTFSTYSLDTLNLYKFHGISLAVANVLISNIGGVVLVILGYLLGRQITGA